MEIVLIDSCFVNSCSFGIPMEGDEVRVFKHHHLQFAIKNSQLQKIFQIYIYIYIYT